MLAANLIAKGVGAIVVPRLGRHRVRQTGGCARVRKEFRVHASECGKLDVRSRSPTLFSLFERSSIRGAERRLAMATATRKARAPKQVASEAVGVSETGSMEFQVFRDNGGEYHWTIVTGSGESLAQSGSFASHADAEHAARYVYEGAGSARFEVDVADGRRLVAV
jgi:uncharacterized protein YegP (UPF0339 family)